MSNYYTDFFDFENPSGPHIPYTKYVECLPWALTLSGLGFLNCTGHFDPLLQMQSYWTPKKLFSYLGRVCKNFRHLTGAKIVV